MESSFDNNDTGTVKPQQSLNENDIDIQQQADLLLKKHMENQFPENKVSYRRIALISFLVFFIVMNIVIAVIASKL